MHVNILKFWKYPDILRQTPNRSGVWRGIDFTVDKAVNADYVVIHGHINGPRQIIVPAGNLWMVMGEPPNEARLSWHVPPRWVDRLYMTEESMVSGKLRLSTAYLPWWVDRDFDSLVAFPPPPVTGNLSWVTSDSMALEGHRYRMRYLDRVQNMSELNLFGRGFRPISGKWDALAGFRYSIAFENYSNAMYFTEKVMDCFLAWSMPIYFGCTQLERFFPVGSFVRLDPEADDPVGFLKSVIQSDVRERNLDLIAEARRRVLYDYNLFNLIATEVETAERERESSLVRRERRLIWDHTSNWRQVLPKFLQGGLLTRFRRFARYF